jgi:hypothetical protein
MDTNSHYGHLSVRDGRSLRVAKIFLVKPVGDASHASPMVYPRLCTNGNKLCKFDRVLILSELRDFSLAADKMCC